MIVETLCHLVGVKPTWYVDEQSLDAYQSLGLKAKVGGKLCPARNMALDDAAKKNLVCVEVSDDIAKWVYYDIAKQDVRGGKGFDKSNAALAGAKDYGISPLAAAQLMLAKLRTHPSKPKLCGVACSNNAALAMGQEDYNTCAFILGDFFVAEPSSKVRFDETMTLKEDYDFTCSHIKEHGAALRCNKMMVYARHSTNQGGAVASRDGQGKKERENIAILQRKWPGVFQLNKRRPNEVLMRWQRLGKPDDAAAAAGPAKLGKKASPIGKLGKMAMNVKNKFTKTTSNGFNMSAKVKYTGKVAVSDYINRRLKNCDGKTVGQILGREFKHKDTTKKYGTADLKYDLSVDYLRLVGAGRLGA